MLQQMNSVQQAAMVTERLEEMTVGHRLLARATLHNERRAKVMEERTAPGLPKCVKHDEKRRSVEPGNQKMLALRKTLRC